MFDTSLGHPGGGNYHYHVLPPWIDGLDKVMTDDACVGICQCVRDVRKYALSFFENYKTLTVVGMAKDGHLVVGPYD